MAHLCLAFAQQAALPIMHLRSINPHMHPMLRPGKGGNRGVCIPRQAAGMIGNASKALPLTAGVSAFAFQGTNAHVIMAAATAATSSYPHGCSHMAGSFQQQRHWIAPMPHAMLLTAQISNKSMTYHADLATPANAYLKDHVVSEQCLLPATAFFELAYSSVKLSFSTAAVTAGLVDATLAAPLPLHQPQHGQRAGAGVVSVQVDTYKGALTIFSHSASQHQYHVFAAVAAQQPNHTHRSSVTQSSALLASVLGLDRFHMPSADSACPAAAISGLAEPVSSPDALNMHPAAADSTLQLASSFSTHASTSLQVPAKLQAMHIHSDRYSQPSWACASPMTDKEAAGRTHSFGLMPTEGQAVVTLQGLTLQPLSTAVASSQQEASMTASQDCLYELTWPADCMATHSSMDRAVVPFKRGKSSMYATATAISHLQARSDQQLCFATAGSVAVLAGRPTASCISSTAQTSLVRSAAQESADCSVTSRLTDPYTLDSSLGSAAITTAQITSASMDEVSEAAFQGRVQHAPRLVPSQLASSAAPFQLLPKPRGALQNLVPEPLHMNLAADEVLLEVHAVGVNFRDVLNVLGMYPGDPGPPGADCAGVVIAKGPAVRKLDIGKENATMLASINVPHHAHNVIECIFLCPKVFVLVLMF